MTAPCVDTVTDMTLHLGDRPGPLRLDLTRGAALVDGLELHDTLGPVDWPPDTTAWLRIHTHGFDVTWPVTVTGPVLSWTVPPTQVDAVPHDAHAQLWLAHSGREPVVWREGRVSFGA